MQQVNLANGGRQLFDPVASRASGKCQATGLARVAVSLLFSQLEAVHSSVCFDDLNPKLHGVLQVYKGILHGSTPVAIKFITRQTHKEKLRFVSEIHILKNLRHVNVSLLKLLTSHNVCQLLSTLFMFSEASEGQMYSQSNPMHAILFITSIWSAAALCIHLKPCTVAYPSPVRVS